MSGILQQSLMMFALFAGAEEPLYEESFVFPLNEKHSHAAGIVECPNGDLLVSWYWGSGERKADDVAIYGSRKKKGSNKWEDHFLMADHPGFPDCNTCMMIDEKNRLWLFWPIIIDNNWESALTTFLISSDYMKPRSPKWDHYGVIYLRPENFEEKYLKDLEYVLSKHDKPLTARQQKYIDTARSRAGDKLYQRLGWMTRCKPLVLPSGRILLPLYSDTFSNCLMAISDDNGRTWRAGRETMNGHGNIQAALMRKDDGTIVAYMRENGFTGKIRVSESKDDGETWSPVYSSELPNPHSGLDAVRLQNGHWLLIYNDLEEGRNQLAVSISEDEGKSWKWTRHLEKYKDGGYHYPAVIQGKDGMIHAIYTYSARKGPKGEKRGENMKMTSFNEAWIQMGDQPGDFEEK